MSSKRFLPRQFPTAPGAPAHFSCSILRSPACRPACRALALALLLAIPPSPKLSAQNSGLGAIPTQNHLSTRPNDTSLPLRDATGTEDQRILQMRNAARQMSLLSDAGKLLRLANELHAEVAAANAPALTDAQLRKLQQIEKLARKVRLEMAIAVGDRQGGNLPIDSLSPR